MSAYQRLETAMAELDALEGAVAMLHWDSEVMMPSGSIEARSEQISALAGVIHHKQTDPHMAEWIEQAEAETLNDWQQANLREIKRQYYHATAVSDALVMRLSKATARCEHAWRQARADDDYEAIKPAFAEVLDCMRQSAAMKAEALGVSAYDALLDQFDPGMRSAEINGYFAELEDRLPPLVEAITEQQKHHSSLPEAYPMPIAAQQALSHHLMQQLGFDFTRGRADISTHPFCGGVPGDIRLTSRFDETDCIEGLYATLHETGHALYEMGLPESWRQQPVGKARGMSLHESQSLFVEMQLCLQPAFLDYLLAQMQHLPQTADIVQETERWNSTSLYQRLTHVHPSFIRVTADEVTYPLHVIMRYKLEQALLSGELSIDDLPVAWNDAMEKNLGIRPATNREGCLQDTHWFGGAIGYFPTYTLGAMIAAQLMHAMQAECGNMSEEIRRGDFTRIIGWLREKVHQQASLHGTQALLQQATGQHLSPSIYMDHLKQRYLG